MKPLKLLYMDKSYSIIRSTPMGRSLTYYGTDGAKPVEHIRMDKEFLDMLLEDLSHGDVKSISVIEEE